MLTTLSTGLRRHLDQVGACPRRSADDLERQVNQYLRHVREAASRDAFVDVSLAERIGSGLIFLLHRAHRFDEEQRALLQAAVLYFIEDDDQQPDVEGPGGFDDDAEVLDYVLGHLGFHEQHLHTET